MNGAAFSVASQSGWRKLPSQTSYYQLCIFPVGEWNGNFLLAIALHSDCVSAFWLKFCRDAKPSFILIPHTPRYIHDHHSCRNSIKYAGETSRRSASGGPAVRRQAVCCSGVTMLIVNKSSLEWPVFWLSVQQTNVIYLGWSGWQNVFACSSAMGRRINDLNTPLWS